MQGHGKFLARRAHGRAAPQIHDQPLRPVAVILQMTAQQFLGQRDALGIGRWRGHRARIDAEKVAPGGHHIRPPPVGRSRRPRRDKAPVQRRHQAVAFTLATGAGAPDMQPLAILAFLDVADKAVDAGDRLGGAGLRRDAQIGLDAKGARLVADGGDQTVAPRRVHAVGGRVFVKAAFQPRHAGGQRAGPHRRRHMTKRDRPDAAFGLRGLARIVDDEGIDHRQCPGQGAWPAGIRQRHRLARQPFQRAMRAHMDQRMGVLFGQPQIEGDIGVAGHAGQVVIAVLAALGVAAFGLQGQPQVSALRHAQMERAVAAIGVGLGRAPCGQQIVPQRLRQAGQRRAVIVQRPCHGAFGHGRAGGHVISGIGQHPRHRCRRGGGVQTDRMGDLPVAPRIGGQDQRHSPVGHRHLRQPRPCRDPVHRRRHQRGIGAMGKAGILQIGVAPLGRFETDDTGKDPAIDLGQDHVHRQIRGRQPAFRHRPFPPAIGG
ncbi:hypothetical protein PANO111632_19235 [Paracoccus nototheniae]